MKILVVSDSHGDRELLYSIVLKHKDSIDLVIHLGDNLIDGIDIMRSFPTVAFLGVLGNCDYASMYADAHFEGTFFAEGKRIFYTHGHKYNVDYGVEYLAQNAKLRNADIALFGHTHVSKVCECSTVTIINPGSISRPRDGSGGSYALIEIKDSNLTYKICEVQK